MADTLFPLDMAGPKYSRSIQARIDGANASFLSFRSSRARGLEVTTPRMIDKITAAALNPERYAPLTPYRRRRMSSACVWREINSRGKMSQPFAFFMVAEITPDLTTRNTNRPNS